MKKSTLYSIGYGKKSLEEFLEELQSFEINYVVDVRSVPYSKWHSQYNKDLLEQWLKKHQITYVFMGDSLGGQPDDEQCYDQKGSVIYQNIIKKESFQKALGRLMVASQKSLQVALLCSESDPKMCHRSKLVGQQLSLLNIDVEHILSKNKSIGQQELMNEFLGDESALLFEAEK